MGTINIFFVYIIGLVLSLFVQLTLGANLGIIFMIFISVCVMHDFIKNILYEFMENKNAKKRR